jgi:hypothetical protein
MDGCTRPRAASPVLTIVIAVSSAGACQAHGPVEQAQLVPPAQPPPWRRRATHHQAPPARATKATAMPGIHAPAAASSSGMAQHAAHASPARPSSSPNSPPTWTPSTTASPPSRSSPMPRSPTTNSPQSSPACPAFGPVLSAEFIALTGGIDRNANSGALAAHAGHVPVLRHSGTINGHQVRPHPLPPRAPPSVRGCTTNGVSGLIRRILIRRDGHCE